MDSTAPWWGDALIALSGSAFGTVTTSAFIVLSRRTERRRLARDQKTTAYPAVSVAAGKLVHLPVWPADAGDPAKVFEALRDLCTQTAFFGKKAINRPMAEMLRAARTHGDVVALIRRDTQPGHGDAIDRRFSDRYRDSRAQLKALIDRFVEAARRDLEVSGPYLSIEENTLDSNAGGGPTEER